MDSVDFPSRKHVYAVPNWALVLLLLAYALPGNVGHVPWKGDDVLHIGIAAEMLRNGNWLTPKLAGMFYFDWPPLLYWLGNLLAIGFGWLLPVHDAIRLASAFGLFATVVLLRFAAYEIYGRDAATGTALLLLGSLGLLIPAHEMQPQILAAACLASTLYGLALLPRLPIRGAWFAGMGAGFGLLSGGLVGLALNLPLWLVPVLTSNQHGTVKAKTFGLAALVALVISLPWLLATAKLHPDFLAAWWQQELLDIAPHKDLIQRLRAFANLFGWFAWPLWPVAAASLWRRRGNYHAFGHGLPVASLLVALWIGLTTGPMRPANLIPLLAPLVLIATAELCRLRRGAANAFDWFGVITFSLIGLFLWFAWSAESFGWPASLARNITRLVPGFVPSWSLLELAVALLLSVAWGAAIVKVPFFQLRGAVHWALGVTLSWGIATTLWLSWFDFDRNYTSTVAEISTQLGKTTTDCVTGIDVGESQRAALYYFGGISVQPLPAQCNTLLAYASGKRELPRPGEEWQLVWEKTKGRSRFQERFALYKRNAY